jgi:hypothetical protein
MQVENERTAVAVIAEIDELRQSISGRLQPDKLRSITRGEIRELLLLIEHLKVRIADLHILQLPND